MIRNWRALLGKLELHPLLCMLPSWAAVYVVPMEDTPVAADNGFGQGLFELLMPMPCPEYLLMVAPPEVKALGLFHPGQAVAWFQPPWA
jgi:hypothetical protein